MTVGDKVTCRPDGKVRGCEVQEMNDDRVLVEWYPGPQSKWINVEDVVPSEEWSND